MEGPPDQKDKAERPTLPTVVKNVVKLYLLGLLITFLAALVGLLEFFGGWVPPLPGQRMPPEGAPPADSPRRAMAREGRPRPWKPPGSSP